MVQVDLLKTNVRTPDLQGGQRTGENMGERASFKGKRPGRISTATVNRLGVRGSLFKGGGSSRPKRTLTWKLGVDAKFDTDRLWVPSFSRTFSGAETTCGRAARNDNKNDPNYRSKYLQRTGL